MEVYIEGVLNFGNSTDCAIAIALLKENNIDPDITKNRIEVFQSIEIDDADDGDSLIDALKGFDVNGMLTIEYLDYPCPVSFQFLRVWFEGKDQISRVGGDALPYFYDADDFIVNTLPQEVLDRIVEVGSAKKEDYR